MPVFRSGLGPALLLLALLAAAPAYATFTCDASNNATVCAILGEFYSATNGASWTPNTGWHTAAAGMVRVRRVESTVQLFGCVVLTFSSRVPAD